MTKCNKYLLSAGNDCVRFFDLQLMTSMGGFKIDGVIDITEIHE